MFSGRMTAALVIAGAIARQVLEKRGVGTLAQTVQIGKVDEQSDELREAIVQATALSSAQYKQTDGSYRFPDNILVAKGVKPGAS